jgi:hypothetical protein
MIWRGKRTGGIYVIDAQRCEHASGAWDVPQVMRCRQYALPAGSSLQRWLLGGDFQGQRICLGTSPSPIR